MTDLGTLGGASSAATDINRVGTIVGRAQVAGGSNRAFAYTSATGMQSLGTLGGSQSDAVAINDAGDIFGSSDIAGNAAKRAFIYRNGVMSVLGGTFGGTNSAATAANEGQEVVGWASTAGNATMHAFLYSGGTMTDLGTLGTSSEALAVNYAAEVAGRSTLASGVRHAFLVLRRLDARPRHAGRCEQRSHGDSITSGRLRWSELRTSLEGARTPSCMNVAR